MKFKVAVTSSDGKLLDQHFGHCSDFRIAEVDSGSGEWKFVENRKTEQTCHNFSHQEKHVKEVVELLSDCRYLLTYRIGSYPCSLFLSRGIECLETSTEEPAPLEQAFRGLRRYLADRPALFGGKEETGPQSQEERGFLKK